MQINSVPALEGFHWILRGVRTFLKRPWALSGLVLLVLLCLAGVTWVCFTLLPGYLFFPGFFVANQVVTLFFAAGLLLACKQADSGVRPRAGVLLVGFAGAGKPARLTLMQFGLVNVGLGMLAWTVGEYLPSLLPYFADGHRFFGSIGLQDIFSDLVSFFAGVVTVLSMSLACRYGVGMRTALLFTAKAVAKNGGALLVWLTVSVVCTSCIAAVFTFLPYTLLRSLPTLGGLPLPAIIVIVLAGLAVVLTAVAVSFASLHHMFESLFKEGDPLQEPQTP